MSDIRHKILQPMIQYQGKLTKNKELKEDATFARSCPKFSAKKKFYQNILA